MSTILDRIADASGIMFLLLVGVGYAVFVAPFSPPSLGSPAEVVTFLDTHPLDWRFPVGVAMELIGLLALVVFAARLAGRIRAVTEPGQLDPRHGCRVRRALRCRQGRLLRAGTRSPATTPTATTPAPSPPCST